MKLLIAIPALNEEDSIEAIIERSLDAREHIVANSPVSEVEITVVSDGSTDRTADIARTFEPRIRLIVFPENRGYGAAIQTAWEASDAELLSFLDADGTCDPRFFADLCRELELQQAEIALGSRVHKASEMPIVRRVGNIGFAFLLTLFSSSRVRDTASGMRVVRRRCMKRLLPLPDGLHFTPAMSAKAVLSEGVKIIELDMPYHERAGESKLKVARDGLRFLRVILEAAFLYHPSRPLGLLGAVFLAAAVLPMIGPAVHYWQHRSVQEWMIYRFIVSHLAVVAGLLLLSASYLTSKMVGLAIEEGAARSLLQRQAGRLLESRLFWLIPGALFVAGGLLVVPSLLELVRTGATYEHWSRFIVMSQLYSVAFVLAVTRIVDYVLGLWDQQAARYRRVGEG